MIHLRNIRAVFRARIRAICTLSRRSHSPRADDFSTIISYFLDHFLNYHTQHGLLCSNQTHLLALRASQPVFFAKPAAKNPALRAFCRLLNDGGRGFKSIWTSNQNQKKPPGWMTSSDLVAGDGLEPTTSGLWVRTYAKNDHGCSVIIENKRRSSRIIRDVFLTIMNLYGLLLMVINIK